MKEGSIACVVLSTFLSDCHAHPSVARAAFSSLKRNTLVPPSPPHIHTHTRTKGSGLQQQQYFFPTLCYSSLPVADSLTNGQLFHIGIAMEFRGFTCLLPPSHLHYLTALLVFLGARGRSFSIVFLWRFFLFSLASLDVIFVSFLCFQLPFVSLRKMQWRRCPCWQQH